MDGGEGRAQSEWASRRRSRGDAVLTGAHGVWKVPPRAGLPVLEVVLQQHFAQLVALQGRERGLRWPISPSTPQPSGPGPEALDPVAKPARHPADLGTHPVPILGLLKQHLLQRPQHLDTQLLLRLHEVLGVLDQPGRRGRGQTWGGPIPPPAAVPDHGPLPPWAFPILGRCAPATPMPRPCIPLTWTGSLHSHSAGGPHCPPGRATRASAGRPPARTARPALGASAAPPGP